MINFRIIVHDFCYYDIELVCDPCRWWQWGLYSAKLSEIFKLSGGRLALSYHADEVVVL